MAKSASCCGGSQVSAPPRFADAMRDWQTLLTALCGLALVASFFVRTPWVAYASVLFGAYFALQAAHESLRERRIDVNFLMVLAAAGAVAVGEPRDAGALLFLFSLSSTLESYAMARTRSAIEGLVRLRPEQAIRVLSDREEKVRVEEIQLGDLVRVPPYEPFPLDGTIIQGESSVDQSAMTGESVPAAKAVGDDVLAGTSNLGGMLVIRSTSTVGDSTLDKIVELVRDAQENKASGERISTWFGQRYTIFVLGAFVASLALRLAFGAPLADAAMLSLVLLVALSPCALVISTPATTLSALAWAARNGILVRGGEYVEAAGKVEIVALDKTGTLTVGRPVLHEICLCERQPVAAGQHSESCSDDHACWRQGRSLSDEARGLLLAAAAAEQYATHPVADALKEAARFHAIEVPPAEDHRTTPGLGVSATVGGRPVHVGQRRYLEAQGVELDTQFVEHLDKLQREGMTIAVMAFDGKVAALGFVDAPREEATSLVKDLCALGVRQVVLLTGDTPETARFVGDQVQIDDVRAGLLPDEKTAAVRQLAKDGGAVMMVGDGVNDAPSLAAASVGVAMGGLGSDIALNAAHAVLMHDRLDRIPQLIRLGRLTNGVIRANLLFASGVIVVLTAASLFWRLPLPLAVIGHEGSTVVVILNGLRLLRGPR